MHDPFTLIGSLGSFALWHRDKGGDHGACGWFMRARHGDPAVLKRIEAAFEFEWDASYGKDAYGNPRADGLFFPVPPGYPALSIYAIALQLFFKAAYEHFRGNRRRAARFMQRNLYEILSFAENPHDSASTGWTFKYGVPERQARTERIHETAVMIYGWVLRETRPWYRHPRWHMHHWRITWRHRVLPTFSPLSNY